jgi:cytidine deaminase
MSDTTFSEDTLIGNTNVPWSEVRAAASEVLLNSWSPYSNFRVGAAALLQDGRIVAGTNIENASYGLTFCGEISMIGANVSGGRSPLVGVVVVGLGAMPLDGEEVENPETSVPFIIGPCGRCRHVMAEHSDENTEILSSTGPKKLIGDVLPYYGSF